MMHGMHGGGFGMHANPFTRPMNWSALGKVGEISPHVQKHLQKVYATLCGGIMACALGVYIDDKFRLAGVMTQILLIVMVCGMAFIHGRS